jgi:3-isopropylmalate/(R)-2-methylmalate dehydratase small subunit
MRAIEGDPSVEIVVDVERRRVTAPAADVDEPFDLDDFTQYRLLNGLDDIGLTMRHDDDIATHEAHRAGFLPTVDDSR